MNREAYGSFELNLSQETSRGCSQAEQSNAAPASARRGNSLGDRLGQLREELRMERQERTAATQQAAVLEAKLEVARERADQAESFGPK
jgi:hypothetical protein